ncbi:hypothetical protein AZE42_10931 [Rhizopogon vesiculosus]|uniref:Uncharacterized protein n=1 Tax=Rhizopogon vesiculosus TaxID=180088 RepID=A0A1J8Q3A0_9AGAM|nr:hypothetical protein AZE42_10931 [Rhizopogon vesiculosus]
MLNTHKQSAELLDTWTRLRLHVVEMNDHVERVPSDDEQRETSSIADAKEYGIFAVASKTLKSVLPRCPTNSSYLYVSGQAWLSKKCQYQIFQFFTACIKPKSTGKLLKPNVDSLVANFAFPQFTRNASM